MLAIILQSRDVNKEEIQKLINYIEENLRTSDETEVEFLDARNYKPRLTNKQNQVIFGRRGSGKSLLMKTLNGEKNHIYIKTNLEDFKDTSFPNSILHVLNQFLKGAKEKIGKNIKWYEVGDLYKLRKLKKKISVKIEHYNNQLNIPDAYDESLKSKTTKAAELNAGAAKGPMKGSGKASFTGENESQKTYLRDKLSTIKNEIPVLKELIKEISIINNSIPLFLGLDDFYFIRKLEQPFFIDFFHRLTKDTNLYIKVGTIRYRSKLYTTTEESYVGTELGHDIQEIDLDYTLDRFDLLQTFLKELLEEAIKQSKAQLKSNDLFSENGFKQLCMASGGVPRDFLSLLLKLLNGISEAHKINKIDVTDVAISNFRNKTDAFAKDSAEEKEVLEYYLAHLKDFLFNQKRTNMFLVCNPVLEDYPQISQAIKELMDLRMIHLVEPITSSAPSDGKKYSAYMIDIGLYTNSKPRNFNQIEPGASDDKARKDKIRASPKLNLTELSEELKRNDLQLELELSQ